MPTFSSDGVDIYYEVAGEGYPMVLSHEFAEGAYGGGVASHFVAAVLQALEGGVDSVHSPGNVHDAGAGGLQLPGHGGVIPQWLEEIDQGLADAEED